MMSNDFVKGMVAGMVAGAALGLIMAPRKKGCKSSMRKTFKTAGEIIGGITDAILS